MTDVRNAINAGKEVTISQTQVHAFGWSGTGYIVLDPESGVGGYLIGGGADGGWTNIPIFPPIVLFFATIFLAAAILAFISPMLAGLALLVGGILLLGCTLANVYHNDSPATWSLYAAGLAIGAVGLIQGISVAMGRILYGLAAVFALPPLGTWFGRECVNA